MDIYISVVEMRISRKLVIKSVPATRNDHTVALSSTMNIQVSPKLYSQFSRIFLMPVCGHFSLPQSLDTITRIGRFNWNKRENATKISRLSNTLGRVYFAQGVIVIVQGALAKTAYALFLLLSLVLSSLSLPTLISHSILGTWHH